jgi:hypothetical protein
MYVRVYIPNVKIMRLQVDLVSDDVAEAWKYYFSRKFPGVHVITFASFQSSTVKFVILMWCINIVLPFKNCDNFFLFVVNSIIYLHHIFIYTYIAVACIKSILFTLK